MGKESKRVLWADDDGKRRFRYECRVLRERGWQTDWALDIQEAAKKLATQKYLGLVLDQSLPYRKGEGPPGIAGGYLLLHWLRHRTLPAGVHLEGASGLPGELSPLAENREVQVLFVSAYYDGELDESIRETSPLDREIEIAPKPLDPDVLVEYLERQEGTGHEGKH